MRPTLRRAWRTLNRVTEKAGFSVVRTEHLTELEAASGGREETPSTSADEREPWVAHGSTDLIVDPDLVRSLTDDYRSHPLSQMSGLWDANHAAQVPLRSFRGDHHYVWQRRSYDQVHYLATLLYTSARDHHRILPRIEEDGSFGVDAVEFEGRLYSRDLLDSANEINFLLDHVPVETLRPLRIVDVGAGYGRLAHRLASVLPDAHLYCVDGIPLSTAICDAYIRYRGLTSQVSVVPLTRLDTIPRPVPVATNVHSFSEMSYEAIEWWVDWLVDRGVQYLFVVPNFPGPALNDGRSFRGLLEERSFELWKTRPKYPDAAMERHGLYPGVYYLFRRG